MQEGEMRNATMAQSENLDETRREIVKQVQVSVKLRL